MKSNKASILRGMGYSFAQAFISWIIFYLIICSPLHNFDYFLFIAFAIWFLAIPFYFMGKKNCNGFFPLFAFISNLIMSYVMGLATFFLDLIFADYLPYIDGWGRFVFLYPFFAIPIIGAIPIVIDAILYLFKAIWKLLGNRKSI